MWHLLWQMLMLSLCLCLDILRLLYIFYLIINFIDLPDAAPVTNANLFFKLIVNFQKKFYFKTK